MASPPSDRRYAESHEWHKPEGDTVTVGITQFAVDELTDITFVEYIKNVGEVVKKGEAFAEVESVKATSEIYAGIDGEVVEVNEALADEPSKLNDDPFNEAWLVKIKPTTQGQLDELMDAETYEKQAG